MPTFCRHNRLIQNCVICAREQSVELRPLLSSSAPKSGQPQPVGARTGSRRTASDRPRGSEAVRVRRLERGADDGYRTRLAPGLRSSADAERLAGELAFASGRLAALREDPPGLYAEVAGSGDIEERTWLAFLIAYLCPLDGEDPFSSIQAVRTSWASGTMPALEALEALGQAQTGPRTSHDPDRGSQTLEAYRAWARRAGSQASAFGGEQGWGAERRFARVFERLSLPGLQRDARFDVLVTLGWLGVYELKAGTLVLGGENPVTVASKRVFGIGDPLLLERRARELADACHVPLESLDLALYNWSPPPGHERRTTLGVSEDDVDDRAALAPILSALGI